MTSDQWQIAARCLRPPGDRVEKISGRWFVRDPERPGEFLDGPIFKRKKDAVTFAELNGSAAYERVTVSLYGRDGR